MGGSDLNEKVGQFYLTINNFFEKEINDMRKEQSIKTNKLRKESLFI